MKVHPARTHSKKIAKHPNFPGSSIISGNAGDWAWLLGGSNRLAKRCNVEQTEGALMPLRLYIYLKRLTF